MHASARAGDGAFPFFDPGYDMTDAMLQTDDAVNTAPYRSATRTNPYDLLCFSHLRWDFVFQRPQHLLTRFGVHHRVFYVEEPVIEDVGAASLRIECKRPSLYVVTPVLPLHLAQDRHEAMLRTLIDRLVSGHAIRRFGCLYYTPMALPYTDHLDALFVAYDCMDELSLFKDAPSPMRLLERALLSLADVVFTGGWSLYESKHHQHPNVHALPSSIDADHFRHAREPDRGTRRHPGGGMQLGFFGVIDERFDGALVAGVAALRPGWDITLVGPVAKIDPAALPRSARLHYPGMAAYDELPAWLASWDVAIMPFARNASTRYISPTKTPEYLAGGKPVVSTSIHDVVHPYAELDLVRIADTPQAFVAACEQALATADAAWLARVDRFLATTSWDRTWSRMAVLIEQAIARRSMRRTHAAAATSQASP